MYELLRARHEGDEERAHLLVRKLSRRDLQAVVKGLTDVALSSLDGALRTSGHEDPQGWIGGFLERVSGKAVDAAVNAQVFEDPPPFLR
ncbi:hypothetical protein [Streptomyces sp. NPDC052225]|uniref:hypothetical protein n=1 Tax=Streptomyces sp. NPDC052225 TaxID=3154949 RepID=UPI00342C2142